MGSAAGQSIVIRGCLTHHESPCARLLHVFRHQRLWGCGANTVNRNPLVQRLHVFPLGSPWGPGRTPSIEIHSCFHASNGYFTEPRAPWVPAEGRQQLTAARKGQLASIQDGETETRNKGQFTDERELKDSIWTQLPRFRGVVARYGLRRGR
jgi:hypothetical protein